MATEERIVSVSFTSRVVLHQGNELFRCSSRNRLLMFAQIVSRGYILLKPVAPGFHVEEILICLQIAITCELPELLLKLIYSNLVSARTKFDPLQKYSIHFASINAPYKFNFVNNLIVP